ncbi:MAG: hypothetical protein GY841_15215 [FCB group bacterium]|nr:hypothetical protein [FCB group bacterium]
MQSRLFSTILGVFLAIMLVAAVSAGEAAKTAKAGYAYIGAKKCSMCHKKDGIKESWMTSKHATAWDDLTPEQQKDDALKPYYTTGTTAKGELLTGVQCEVCHGPGSAYKKKTIMKDHKEAIANGLLVPDEKACLKCHNEKAPTKALAASAKDFSYEKMKAKGVHKKAVKAAPKK